MSKEESTALPEADFSAYLGNLKRLSEARRRKGTIEDKIAIADAAQSRALAQSPRSDELKRQAEDLAAAIALGLATPAEAEKRRADIAKLEASLAKGLAEARAAGDALAGLERALASVNSDIDSMESGCSELLALAFREHAERLGAEYAEHARGLRQCFIGLMALDRLHYRLAGTRQKIAFSVAYELFIPAFNLKCHEHLRGSRYKCFELFSNASACSGADLAQHIHDEAVPAERERLRELGVKV